MEKGLGIYGIAEIGEALGARKETVAQWHHRGRLPEPDFRLAMGPVWLAQTIEPWIEGKARQRAEGE